MKGLSPSKLKSRTARDKLDISKRPYWLTISPNISLGYRRNAGAGTWSVRSTAGKEWVKRIAHADDREDADGAAIMDFEQAQEAARALVRNPAGAVSNETPVTVTEAVAHYEQQLENVGGCTNNAKRLRYHVEGTALANKPVMLLTARDLQDWRDGLLKKTVQAKGGKLRPISRATVNRTRNCLRSALTLAAMRDARITNKAVWQDTEIFEALPDATKARNVVLSEIDVNRLVNAGYDLSHALGLLFDVMATTGARPSQIARLTVRDLHDDYLTMPRSGKGHKNKRLSKKAEYVQVDITPALAKALKAEAGDRPLNAPLLLRDDGTAWSPNNKMANQYGRAVGSIVEQLGLKSEDGPVTLYALRHSSIVRQLLAGWQAMEVAKLHDTSVGEINRHYARYLDRYRNRAARRKDLFVRQPEAANVVPLAA